ncbi:site-specific integrase [Larkinella humicola]|uniref:Tyrosine-type recombinase/integrase n=1 Tax=Larkinella humicola TaxID=2607654 RepID=A0A5N1JD81_9BACT|nr:site-specific integrase [Larkinella humicola]KAA9349723.1 tyrosine-type recombinase/integrase [Larkinella humicola]
MAKVKHLPDSNQNVRIKRLTVQLYQRGTAIYVKLHYNSRSQSFSSGLKCSPRQLDVKSFTVINDESATAYLQGLRSDFQRAFTDYLLTKRTPDLREIKKLVIDKSGIEPDKPTLIECLDKFYKDEFESLSGIDFERKTVEKKRYLVERIKQYILTYRQNPYLKLSDLKAIDAQQVVTFCKKTYGHGHNHAVLHAEFLKRTLNYAIANEWLEKNPFAFFRPKRERKAVIALKEKDIHLLQETVFHSREYNYVRDVFLFCCYTGLAYVDVSRLNSSHLLSLQNGEQLIKIKRGKNDNDCIIPVVPQALQILDKYTDNQECILRKRLLPVYANQVMNRILKEIQAACNITVRLTTHVARKTCASYYIANGVPLTSVATMLGHKKTSTTELYYTERSEEAVIRHIREYQIRKDNEAPNQQAV